jgi:hypothetical protein
MKGYGVSAGVVLHAVIDACHSGSMLDLEFRAEFDTGAGFPSWTNEYGNRPMRYKARFPSPSSLMTLSPRSTALFPSPSFLFACLFVCVCVCVCVCVSMSHRGWLPLLDERVWQPTHALQGTLPSPLAPMTLSPRSLLSLLAPLPMTRSPCSITLSSSPFFLIACLLLLLCVCVCVCVCVGLYLCLTGVGFPSWTTESGNRSMRSQACFRGPRPSPL